MRRGDRKSWARGNEMRPNASRGGDEIEDRRWRSRIAIFDPLFLIFVWLTAFFPRNACRYSLEGFLFSILHATSRRLF